MNEAIAQACADAALAAGREIRALVHAMDPRERAVVRTPLLKPHGGYGARHVDAAAEEVGLAHLERLSREVGAAIDVLVDPAAGSTHRIGRGTRAIFVSMDAIDGTVKVAGLGARHDDRVRLANDGGWAVGFAFTAPTEHRLADLSFGDFTIAVVVDGNPTRFRTYPQDLVALPGADGVATWEATETPWRRVFTTSSTDLGQLWSYLDVFQAYDATPAATATARRRRALSALTDRHGGGAFDVLRQYANPEARSVGSSSAGASRRCGSNRRVAATSS
jgi:hypothetical protein